MSAQSEFQAIHFIAHQAVRLAFDLDLSGSRATIRFHPDDEGNIVEFIFDDMTGLLQEVRLAEVI